jgi:hypothetical protein
MCVRVSMCTDVMTDVVVLRSARMRRQILVGPLVFKVVHWTPAEERLLKRDKEELTGK